jgi:hypothetical protein
MRNRWTRLAPLCGMALALGAGGVALAGELTRSSNTVPLPGDGIDYATTAACGKGKAIGGGIELGDAGADAALEFYPSDKREWSVVGRRSLVGDSDLTAHVVCIKKGKVKPRSETVPLPTDAGEISATATCPKGTRATGGGIEVGADGDVARGSYPSGKRRWTVTAIRFTPVDSELTAHVLCVKDRKVKRRSSTAPLPNDFNGHDATAKCPKRTKPTGGGVQITVPTDLFRATGSFPAGKRSWVAFGAALGPDAEITAHVLCLKKPKK